MKTKQEIEKRIEEIRTEIFLNNMTDRWSFWNYQRDDELKSELRQLKEELKKF